MTSRLSKNGNTFDIEPIIDNGKTCYNLNIYNKAGFLVARNPCLSKEDMESEKQALKEPQFIERIIVKRTILGSNSK